ncbi:MAG: substrate-binding domain-containing protein [Desulfocapsaceae bacterium]|nr:substrate-binding domain-containing protein [Desulfocapsaceae bacterium]
MSKSWIMNSFKVIAALMILGWVTGTALAEEVKVGAGAAATENIFNKIKEPMEKANGVKLTVISSGPVQAVKDLDTGAVEAAVGGLTFPDWMAMMEKEGYAIPDKSIYKNRVIGKDIVKVLTNKDVTVTTLSKEQLAAIFTGKAKNWSEVGGPSKPIVVIVGTKIPGTNTVFQKQAMNGEPYSKDAVEGTTIDDLKAKVAATSGAVSLGTSGQIDATINAPTIPEIGRPITLITKGAPTAGLQKMLDFIAGPGQQLIAK